MNKKNIKVVTLRPKGNSEDMNQEPEKKELKRMILKWELDVDRTIAHLENEDK